MTRILLSAITKRDGVPIKTWEDLESLGFQVSVASCIFLHLYIISCTTLLTIGAYLQ
jgi:hypothetical protein